MTTAFIMDQETTGENERDTAYRLALEFICVVSKDMLLWRDIYVLAGLKKQYNCIFYKILLMTMVLNF